MTLVFRVENLAGQGPYTAPNISDSMLAMCDAHDDSDHPTPHKDEGLIASGWPTDRWGVRGIAEEEFCGFSTEEQLHDWFDGWEELLAAEDYMMGVYEVPSEEIRAGTKQVAFRRGKATRIGITEL